MTDYFKEEFATFPCSNGRIMPKVIDNAGALNKKYFLGR